MIRLSSDRDKYSPQRTKPQTSFDIVMAKDKTRIDRFARNANVHKHLLQSVKHFDFTDLPLILNPALSRSIRLFSDTSSKLNCYQQP